MIQIDRLIPESHYLQASILLEQHRYHDALAALRRALFLNPEFIMANFTLGATLKKTGRSSEAGISFENCRNLLRKMPDDSIVPESDGIPAGRLIEMIELL